MNIDKAAKYINKIADLDERIAKCESERENLVFEINAMLNTNSVLDLSVGKKSTAVKKPNNKGVLGGKILDYLDNYPGSTIKNIAHSLNVKANIVAISLHHLCKDKSVIADTVSKPLTGYTVSAPLVPGIVVGANLSKPTNKYATEAS